MLKIRRAQAAGERKRIGAAKEGSASFPPERSSGEICARDG